MLAELDFGQTVAAGFLNALFAAFFVGGAAAIVVRWYESRAEDRRQAAEMQHEEELQVRQLEYQTRAALRETYSLLLVAQRRSREASVQLAKAGGASESEELDKDAVLAHDEFIDSYHRLNLDANREMWEDARGLRLVLDRMLDYSKLGSVQECDALIATARAARQNLERSFRLRLGGEELQDRKDLGEFDRRQPG
jgi:hypothetical protein